jgi:hypothetical protein
LPIFADGPADNNPTTVRRVPPPGIEVPEVERMELEAGLATLQGEIRALRRQLKVQPHRLSLLPDIEIFSKAVAYALRYREFQKPNEFKIARAHLERGRERARQLAAGETPWLTQTGLVVRGFRSHIDDGGVGGGEVFGRYRYSSGFVDEFSRRCRFKVGGRWGNDKPAILHSKGVSKREGHFLVFFFG